MAENVESGHLESSADFQFSYRAIEPFNALSAWLEYAP
jgi:hypothetical protein